MTAHHTTDTTDTTTATTTGRFVVGRHPVSVTHLVMGLVFLGIAGSWALEQLDVLDAEAGRWVLPVVLVIAGVAGLLAGLVKGLARSGDQRRRESSSPSRADGAESSTTR